MVLTCLSCSVQKKISKYEGKKYEEVAAAYGEPYQKVKLDGGETLFIFQEDEYIRPTQIGTGRNANDPIISPGFKKIKEYHFIVNEDYIVTQTHYEEKIER